MARSMRIGLGLWCVCVVVLAAGCRNGGSWQVLERETRVVTAPYEAGAGLRVVSANGAVTVLRADRADVKVSAELRAVSMERLQEAVLVARRDNAGVLEVYVDWPGGKAKNNEGCTFEVILPGAGKVELTTSNGSIVLEDVGAEAVLKTSNGKVVVSGVEGSVVVKTSNGPVHVKHVGGPVDVGTSNGPVEVTDTRGAVTAVSSNGPIEARGLQGAFDLRTSNGGIEVSIAEGFTGEVELKTSNGGVSVVELDDVALLDSGKHHMRLRIGGGDSMSVAKTSNGKVRMEQEE